MECSSFNGNVDKKLAIKLSSIFLEVIAAKAFSKEALEVLNKKKNLRVIKILGLKNLKKKTSKHYNNARYIFITECDASNVTKKILKLFRKNQQKRD